jgi:hypothetical protein
MTEAEKSTTASPTVTDHEMWRLQDTKSSLVSTTEQLEDQLRQNGKGVAGAFLKAGVGGSLQAVMALAPESSLKDLKPVIALVQIGTGLVGAFNTWAEGQRMQDKLNAKMSQLKSTSADIDTLLKEHKAKTNNTNSAPGSEESRADTARGLSSKIPGLHAA